MNMLTKVAIAAVVFLTLFASVGVAAGPAVAIGYGSQVDWIFSRLLPDWPCSCPEAGVVDYGAPPPFKASPSEAQVGVVVDGLSLSSSPRTLDVTVFVALGDEAKARLYDPTAHTFLVPDVYASAGYADLLLRVTIAAKDGSRTDGTVRLYDVLHELSGGQVKLHLPIAGSSTAYPSDTYSSNGTVTLSFPSSPVLPAGGSILRFEGGPTPKSDLGAAAAMVFVSRSVGGLSARFHAGLQLLDSTSFDIYVHRNSTSVLFVYGLVVIPLAFAIAVGSLWFRTGSTEREQQRVQFVASIATFILTALPIRAVLVPNDVTGLTTVDFLLGVQLIALLWISGVAYAVEAWS